jgi:hypothetical protein
MEPLCKDLVPGISAQLDADGNLTFTRVSTILFFRWTTRFTLPPQAARALLNFLRREQSRERIGYRLWQKEGSSQE